jgi:tetratricopeptide (TPR) repeat protein
MKPGRMLALISAGLFLVVLPSFAQKEEPWLEIRSPNFTVYTNVSDKDGRRIAEQFEQIRALFRTLLPEAKLDSWLPMVVLLAKNEKTMKALLPEYWEDKKRAKPAGVFFDREEKDYIAMRLDSTGDNPYHTVYHEYVHSLTRLNIRVLPAWLDEGLAEFYGNTVIRSKEVGVGTPNEDVLYYLQQQSLIPFEIFFAVTHDSSIYRNKDQKGVFYAQAWALVHYSLLSKEVRAAKREPLLDFMKAADQGLAPAEAATRAFGDLKKLAKTMEAYVRQSSFFYAPMKAPSDLDEKQFGARPLSPAEAAALRGEFLAQTQRPKEARALLELALNLNPKSAQAAEAMGMLFYAEKNFVEAEKWFAKAVESDSRSFMAHYLHARLLIRERTIRKEDERVENGLLKSIALNPNFPWSHSLLAFYLSSYTKRYEEAFQAARKAIALDPGNANHYVQAGQALMRMERADEALAYSQRAMQVARNASEQSAAFGLNASIQQFRAYLSERKRYEEERAAYEKEREESLRAFETEKKRREEEIRAQEEAASKAAKAPGKAGKRPPTTSRAGGPKASLEGTIAGASCPAPPALVLTLAIGEKEYKFRTENYFKMDVMSLGWTAPANFQPCSDMPKGRRARVEFTPSPGSEFFGILHLVEIQ